MGYRGTIRSLNAIVNASARASRQRSSQQARENQRRLRQQEALQSKLQKKNLAINDKRSRPLQKLKDMYASGKIDTSQYNQLIKRDAEITIDLIVFGRAAGLTIGERYILGKIDQTRFEELKDEVLGAPEAEKDAIIESIDSQITAAKEFVKRSSGSRSESECGSCGSARTFFSPLSLIENMMLCKKCRKTYDALTTYPGHDGQYYHAEGMKLDIQGANQLSIFIKTEIILNY